MWDPQLGDLQSIITLALAEDLPATDVTTLVTVPAKARARAHLVAKSPLVMCGLDIAEAVFRRLDPDVEFVPIARDGHKLEAGQKAATISGAAQALLGAERTALNFVQRLSGVATLTHAYVQAADAAGKGCRVTDTRKTTPGLRALQRYAVRCGGGHNHRNDLSSGVLIKENHIRCGGGIARVIKAARANAPHTLRIECEVTDMEELRAAVDAGADVVMLDNMSDPVVAEAVAWVDGRAIVEVSGSVALERVRGLAELGIDVVSVGALTHSAGAADLSLLVEVADGSGS